MRSLILRRTVSQIILAAIYPLSIVWPRQAGTSPEVGEPAFPAGHVILWACPGEIYNRLSQVRGGMPPYTFWITGGEGDIAVDQWGEITKTIGAVSNGTTYTQTLHVRDAHGTEVSSEWTITADATKFVWLAETGANGGVGNDSTGAGTKASPWRTLGKLQTGAYNDKFAILRGPATYVVPSGTNSVVQRTVTAATSGSDFVISGTDDPEGTTLLFLNGPNAGIGVLVENNTGGVEGGNHRVNSWHGAAFPSTPGIGDIMGAGDTWQRVQWRGSSGHCCRWMGYEGEVASIDFNFQAPNTNWGFMQRFWAESPNPAYLDNLTFTNALDKCIQFQTDGACDYPQTRRITPTATAGRYGIDGSNSGVFMQMTSFQEADQTWYDQYDSITAAAGGAVGILKTYSRKKPQYQRINTFDQAHGWDLKAAQVDFEVKFCKWQRTTDQTQGGLFGNFAGGFGGIRSTGVIYHTLIDMRNAPTPGSAVAFQVGQQGDVGEVWVVNSTLIGRAEMWNVNAGDGPVHWYQDVILNTDSGSTDRILLTTSDGALRDSADILSGSLADGYVDVDGKLTGAARASWLGIRGHEIAGFFS